MRSAATQASDAIFREDAEDVESSCLTIAPLLVLLEEDEGASEILVVVLLLVLVGLEPLGVSLTGGALVVVNIVTRTPV